MVVLLLSGGCLFQKEKNPHETSKVIVCVPGWKNIPDMGINASYLTHINYSFVRIRQDGTPYLANPRDEGNLYYLTSLKKQNPQLKILLRVGGWDGSKYFSDVARTDSSRRRFASQLVVMVAMYNVDGVDIDWEYPGRIGAGNHYLPDDQLNFSLLLEDLRIALNRMAFLRSDNQHYLLSIDAGATKDWLDHVVIKDITQVVDFINVMTYDYYGEWDNRTGHISNLFESSCEPYGNSVSQSVRLFEKAGVPPGKIVIGGAFYGRWWRGVEKMNNGLCQIARKKGGHWQYHTIADSVMKIPDYHVYWDKKAKAPYLWNEKEAIFVSYENPRSLEAKVRYLKKKDLGGIMIWEYSGDRHGELLNPIHKEFHR
ncbi:MAG: glycoside hydrolase family 18 protein [Bacteroidales bacterium]|nr:glycoside hydrolase family 18 protein [Bacteroidales bacterium]